MGARRDPLNEAERQAILDDLMAGKSVNRTARDHRRAPSTVHRIAKAAGHSVEHSNLARVRRAQEARKAYGAEARAERLQVVHERVGRVLERMVERHVVFNFDKDGGYSQVEFDEPTSDAIRQYAAAVAQLTKAEMDIVRYDERGDDGGADVDRWLSYVAGGGS